MRAQHGKRIAVRAVEDGFESLAESCTAIMAEGCN